MSVCVCLHVCLGVLDACQGASISARGLRRSPEGPSSASGGRVAAVVARPGREVDPRAEAGTGEAAVCGTDSWSVRSLGADLPREEERNREANYFVFFPF